MAYRGCRWLITCAPIVLLGCPVDNRRLSAIDSESDAGSLEAGSDSSTDGHDSGSASSDADVAADSGLAAPDPLEGCSIVAATLLDLKNPSFDRNTTGWAIEASVDASWSAKDVTQRRASGSLAITNKTFLNADGLTLGGAQQCVPIAANTSYRACTDYYIEAPLRGGSGALSLWVYDEPECAGDLIANETSPLEGVADTWTTARVRVEAPSDARSILIRLIAVKPFEEDPLEVLFDNVRAGVAND